MPAGAAFPKALDVSPGAVLAIAVQAAHWHLVPLGAPGAEKRAHGAKHGRFGVFVGQSDHLPPWQAIGNNGDQRLRFLLGD
jgi:hypothetical protein